MNLKALTGSEPKDVFGSLKVKSITSLTESGGYDPIPGPGILQGFDQHNQWMGGPGFPADLMEVVGQLIRFGPKFLGDAALFGLGWAREDQLSDIAHGEGTFIKETGNGLGDYLAVTFVPGPAFLP
jgi:hypothetical protein